MMNINELGLPDDSLLDINYPIHQRKIRTISSISLIVCIAIVILSIILIYFFMKEQRPASSGQKQINSNGTIPIGITPSVDQPKIKAGIKFGDVTGFDFDDSLIEKFILLSHYVRGINIRSGISPLHWFQCFYSSAADPENLIEGGLHGIQEMNDTIERFFLDQDEKISKIQVKVDNIQLYQGDIPSIRTRLIMGIRFYTKKGRTSRSIDNVDGQMYSEEFTGYTLGYITGKSGRYINQLQFYWYKTF